MPTLVLDLERSSMCCYLSLFERLLDQWGILKHFPQSWCIFNLYLPMVERKVVEFYPLILMEDTIWFGQINLFSWMFGDKCWCPGQESPTWQCSPLWRFFLHLVWNIQLCILPRSYNPWFTGLRTVFVLAIFGVFPARLWVRYIWSSGVSLKRSPQK